MGTVALPYFEPRHSDQPWWEALSTHRLLSLLSSRANLQKPTSLTCPPAQAPYIMTLSIWKSNLTTSLYLFQASNDMSFLLHKPSRHQLQKQWTLHFMLITRNQIIGPFLTQGTGVVWTQTELNLLNRPKPKSLFQVLPNFRAGCVWLMSLGHEYAKLCSSVEVLDTLPTNWCIGYLPLGRRHSTKPKILQHGDLGW